MEVYVLSERSDLTSKKNNDDKENQCCHYRGVKKVDCHTDQLILKSE